MSEMTVPVVTDICGSGGGSFFTVCSSWLWSLLRDHVAIVDVRRSQCNRL